MRFLADQLFRDASRYVALVNPLLDAGADITEAQVWDSQKNPWMHLYTRSSMVGVVKRMLRGTSDEALRNDYYDNLHIVQASVADALVVDDRRLAESILHLRTGDVPQVFMLDEWGAELDRCT